MDYFTTTSPCGIDCFNCELFGDNITPELQERIAQYRDRPLESIRHLQPCVDLAETFPQSFKVFNLCRISKIGLERWAAEEAGAIRVRCYKGRLEIGNGPHLKE